MEKPVDAPAAGGALALPEIMDLKAAAPLAAAFLARRGAALAVDASAVQRLGGQCLAVLLAARNRWVADDLALSFESPSPEFAAAITAFGAGELIPSAKETA